MAEDITELREQVESAGRRHARAVAGLEQSRGRVDAAREELQAEFGVPTLEEAAALAEQIEREVAAEAAAVRAALERAGTQ